MTHCNDALKIDGNNVKALFRRGQVYVSRSDYELAVADFNQVLKADPNNTEVKL